MVPQTLSGVPYCLNYFHCTTEMKWDLLFSLCWYLHGWDKAVVGKVLLNQGRHQPVFLCFTQEGQTRRKKGENRPVSLKNVLSEVWQKVSFVLNLNPWVSLTFPGWDGEQAQSTCSGRWLSPGKAHARLFELQAELASWFMEHVYQKEWQTVVTQVCIYENIFLKTNEVSLSPQGKWNDKTQALKIKWS